MSSFTACNYTDITDAQRAKWERNWKKKKTEFQTLEKSVSWLQIPPPPRILVSGFADVNT